MAKPGVFLSYSTKDATSDALTDLLRTGLADTFDVFLDRVDLQAGDEWRRKLYGWLGTCRAAVILLSRAAVDQSDWVLLETSILDWRRLLDPNFKLIPLLLPDVRPDELTAGRFQALNLGVPQWAKVDPGDLSATVVNVREALAPLTTSPGSAPPLLRARDRIAARIADVPPADLDEAGRRLHLDDAAWSPGVRPETRVAQGLLTADLDEIDDALRYLFDRIPLRDARCGIVNAVRSAWVDAGAAAALAKLAMDPATPPPRGIALNVSEATTGEMYVHRANCDGQNGWFSVNPYDDSAGDAVGRIAQVVHENLRRELKLSNAEGRDRKQLLGYLRRRVARGPVFVVLPLNPSLTPPVEEAVADALRREFPDCTFLLLSGDENPAAGQAGPFDAPYVTPHLPRTREEEIVLKYKDLLHAAEELD